MGNLADISRHTGLGVTTVSEILRNKPGYRDSTRQIVRDAASKLNYHPNLIARGLKAGQTKTIGVIIGSLSTQITLNKIEDIEAAANQAGYTSLVVQSNHERLITMLDNLLARQIDGLILIQQYDPGEAVTASLVRLKIPAVYVGWAPPKAKYTITFDRQDALEQAASHMAGFGHSKATMIRTPSDLAGPALKVEPWRDALESQGMTLDCDPDYLLEPARDYDTAIYNLIRAKAKQRQLPKLLLTNNDEGAAAAIAAFTDCGVSVPGDVSLVGFDDIPMAQFIRPGLTTIHQPRREVGVLAFEMLLPAMAAEAKRGFKQSVAKSKKSASLIPTQGDSPQLKTHHVMSYRFIPRQSVGPAVT